MNELKNLKNNTITTNNQPTRVMMYTTARQFKNAIPKEEMLIIPYREGNWCNYCIPKINNENLMDFIKINRIPEYSILGMIGQDMLTIKGDKFITKTTPFIVNKTIACEIYLKLILSENNISYMKIKGFNGHNISTLYSLLPLYIKKDIICNLQLKHFNDIEEKIKSISNAFINWRYIYENYNLNPSIDFVFLNDLCDCLDEIAQKTIYINYHYDVTRDIR